jgi:hypothetical protein
MLESAKKKRSVDGNIYLLWTYERHFVLKELRILIVMILCFWAYGPKNGLY